MLRITRTGTDETTTLSLEGKLVGQWIGEFEAAGQAAPRLTIDLAAVTFVDADGVRVLRRLMREGHAVKGASRFVAELLREVPQT